MDHEWAIQRICQDIRSILPNVTPRQEAELRLRTRATLKQCQAYGQTIAETKRITILLSDIRGFTAIAETYSAMLVVDMLNRYFSRMCQIIVNHGGTIDKFMGDSIMVLFGAPASKTDDVERALACAVEMQLAMNDINVQNRALDMPELYMGIGINTGSVVAGPLGSDLHSEYTVIGDQVNLTSRIEAQSLRGQILISEATYTMAHDFVEVGKPNHVQVKGKRDPVCLYELLMTTRPREMHVPRRDERKSPRIPVEMPFSFHCLDGKIVTEKRWQGSVLDLSYHGLLAWVPVYLAPFSEIRLIFNTSPMTTESRQCYARILQCQLDQGGYRASMEFSSIDDFALSAIKNFVDSMVYHS